MLSNASAKEEPTMDIIYSLPALSHSVALACRTPAARFTQKSKYMPDYGGILETPDSALKNNNLCCELPFEADPSRFTELKLNRESQLSKNHHYSNDCLVVIPIKGRDQFIIITAQDNCLFVDSLEKYDYDDDSYRTIHLISKQYSDDITGIKLSSEYLHIKFSHAIRLINLNEILSKELLNFENDSYIAEKPGFVTRDSCLNQYNKTIYGIASDHSCLSQVKLYDISSKLGAKQCFLCISWTPDKDNSYKSNEDESLIIDRTLRGRSIRQFLPSKPAIRGIKQLDCLPSHLANMILTTDYKTALIDPRIGQLGQIYVDKTAIPSFYPTEYLKRTIFSNHNGYQFYSLTNIHLRVFDIRYTGLPMNQLNHMLDVDSYNNLNMKVINYRENSLETICCSSESRLSFMTFDQSKLSNLINPKSIHLPYHDDADDFVDTQISSFDSRELYKLYGLDVIYENKTTNNENLFSTLQLLNNGNVLIRDYTKPHVDAKMTYSDLTDRAEFIMDNTRKKFASFRSSSSQKNYNNNNLRERDIINLEDENELDGSYINILDSTPLLSIEDSFESLRARERFFKMKDNFCKL